MAVPLVQEFTALENEGIIAYDALLQCNVIVVAPILNITILVEQRCAVILEQQQTSIIGFAL